MRIDNLSLTGGSKSLRSAGNCARGQSHACARARSPIPLAIGRGETIADIVQREFKVCLCTVLIIISKSRACPQVPSHGRRIESIVLERPQMIVASVLGPGALAFVPGHLPPLSRYSPISLHGYGFIASLTPYFN